MNDSNEPRRTPIADAVASAEGEVRGRIDRAKENFGKTKEYAAERLEKGKEKLEEVAGDFRKRVDEVRERIANKDWNSLSSDVTSYVKDNPGKAMIASVAIGFVLGALLRRNRD